MLARRDRSQAELRTRLRRDAESPAALDAALLRLREEGLQSDQRFAERWVEFHQESHGVERLRADLRQHGIDRDLTESFLAPLRADQPAIAAAILARKFAGPPTSRSEVARRVRFLIGRGFAPEVAIRLLGGADD